MNTPSHLQKENLGNRRARRKAQATNRRRNRHSATRHYSDSVVVTDDSFKDTTKRVFAHGLAAAKERVEAIKKTFRLPTSIRTTRTPGYTTCVIIQRDGRQLEFLPDIPPTRKILVKGHIARQMVSGVCMLTRPTANYDEQGRWIDGSWAITPAEYRMMNVTTIQHVRRRSFWFLRRYSYEISFDGRVNPAHLLFDYELDPTAKRTKFYLTTEKVQVKGKENTTNIYFRFWKHKPFS